MCFEVMSVISAGVNYMSGCVCYEENQQEYDGDGISIPVTEFYHSWNQARIFRKI